MKYTKAILTAALAALLLTSCAEDKITCYPGVPERPVEITTAVASSVTNPMTTTRYDPNTPAATAAPLPDGVAEQYALADLFEKEINRIVLTSGITGAQYTALDTDIDRIADFFRPIKGIAPHSARGYYGSFGNLTLYNGPIEVGRFYLTPSGCFGTGYYETVNGHDYAILYHISGRTADEVWRFLSRYFPADFATTADPQNPDYSETTVNHVIGTAQDWSEVSPPREDDYSTLILPDYRVQNPVRYSGVDDRGYRTDGWQDFGLLGEIRTVPIPMGMTYTYQAYSYFIRNDLTHLYPNETLPQTPDALAIWLADISEPGRRAVWKSMNAGLPHTIELISCEELTTADEGTTLGKATYLADGQRWVFYLLCENGTASVFAVRPNDEGDFVINFTDAIAVSYRVKSVD